MFSGYRLTVRTLDFQSKNVGSIPSNPTILLNYKFINSNSNFKNSAMFSFSFVSLIAPNFITNFTSFFNYSPSLKKIQLKQSYILLTWFYYLTILEKNNKKLKIFILPIKKRIATHLKAPIAHKNWSKEQYLFQYYLFRVTFKNNFINNETPTSVRNGLLFALLTKKHFPVFETNIFFLKNYKSIYVTKDPFYFNYAIFS